MEDLLRSGVLWVASRSVGETLFCDRLARIPLEDMTAIVWIAIRPSTFILGSAFFQGTVWLAWKTVVELCSRLTRLEISESNAFFGGGHSEQRLRFS